MGADAEVFVFDYQRYRAEVVEPLTDLFRTGTPGPRLTRYFREAARRQGVVDFEKVWPGFLDLLAFGPVDLQRYCTWLGEDLRYRAAGEPAPVDHRVEDRESLVCVSETCPERTRCVLHRSRGAAEGLNVLFEQLVVEGCLGRSQFVGRSAAPFKYWPLLDRFGVPAAGPVRRLLAALGSRGAVFGYAFGRTEGVHGWLSESETAELARQLTVLPLPRYAPDFATMAELHGDSMRRTWREMKEGFPDDGVPWGELSLSFVRTVAVIAAAEGQGLLWGNDVGPWPDWLDYFLMELEG